MTLKFTFLYFLITDSNSRWSAWQYCWSSVCLSLSAVKATSCQAVARVFHLQVHHRFRANQTLFSQEADPVFQAHPVSLRQALPIFLALRLPASASLRGPAGLRRDSLQRTCASSRTLPKTGDIETEMKFICNDVTLSTRGIGLFLYPSNRFVCLYNSNPWNPSEV